MQLNVSKQSLVFFLSRKMSRVLYSDLSAFLTLSGFSSLCNVFIKNISLLR